MSVALQFPFVSQVGVTKRCPGCGEEKPIVQFSVCKSGRRAGRPVARCRLCRTRDQKAWRARDTSIYRRIEWKSKLKRHYGLAVEGYYLLLKEQGGGCALCGTLDPTVGAKGRRTMFDVDHCHATGKVRGLLCTRCNRLVGLANDNHTTAERLVAYLKKV